MSKNQNRKNNSCAKTINPYEKTSQLDLTNIIHLKYETMLCTTIYYLTYS